MWVVFDVSIRHGGSYCDCPSSWGRVLVCREVITLPVSSILEIRDIDSMTDELLASTVLPRSFLALALAPSSPAM